MIFLSREVEGQARRNLGDRFKNTVPTPADKRLEDKKEYF